VDSCIPSNESSGSKKGSEFLDRLSNYKLFMKDSFSMKIVMYLFNLLGMILITICKWITDHTLKQLQLYLGIN
jgi:hypothetical protein